MTCGTLGLVPTGTWSHKINMAYLPRVLILLDNIGKMKTLSGSSKYNFFQTTKANTAIYIVDRLQICYVLG